MPVQNRPVEPSAFHELKARVDKMEAEQKRQGRQLVTVDRIVTADLPAPSEGQIAVEASNDAAKYYANGSWREFGNGSAMWPSHEIDLLPYGSLFNNNLNGSWSTVDDLATTGWSSHYVEATTDAAYWSRMVRLGPKGSIWSINYVGQTGPDYGRIKVQLATVTEGSATGYGFQLSDAGILLDPADLTFYTLPRQASGPVTHGDCYQSGGTTVFESWARTIDNWSFRITGDDGAALTADVAWDGTDAIPEANGGAGMWCIRFLTDGKNASSSSYRIRYRFVSLQRHMYPGASHAT